jgi:hypothetical protein
VPRGSVTTGTIGATSPPLPYASAMRAFALNASLPGMLKVVDSASPAGFIAANPAIARTIQSPPTSFLWCSTHRVRVVIALRLDM